MVDEVVRLRDLLNRASAWLPEDHDFQIEIKAALDGQPSPRCLDCGLDGPNGGQDTQRLDWLQAQMKGWADGFCMMALDDGSQYVRPWRKALEDKFPPELKDGTFIWQRDLRTAIDEAIRRTHATGTPQEKT